jgi:hypothetical protein
MTEKNEKVARADRCTWAIPNFPRSVKQRFLAWCKANNTRGGDYLEYLINRAMMANGVTFPKLDKGEERRQG